GRRGHGGHRRQEAVRRPGAATRGEEADGGDDSAAHRHLQGRRLGSGRRRHRSARHPQGARARPRAELEQAGRAALAQARGHARLKEARPMFDFTDEQKMVRKMVRQWADKELAPLVPRMEKGELLPYDTMRKLLKTFGMDEMVRSAFAKMKDEPE